MEIIRARSKWTANGGLDRGKLRCRTTNRLHLHWTLSAKNKSP